MKFWICLFLVNMIFFLPGYFLNLRNQINPFSFLIKRRSTKFRRYIKRIYSRDSSDPFRIVLEFTAGLLIAKWLGLSSETTITILAIVATLGFILTNYTSVMVYIFHRAPVIQSDIEFLKIGMTIAYKFKFLIIAGFVALLILLFYGFSYASEFLLSLEASSTSIIVGLVLFLAFGLFNAHSYGCQRFHERFVYSFIIHLIRNYRNGNKYNFILDKDESFFDQHNLYKDLELAEKPNVVILSIESYGSIVFKEPEIKKEIEQIFEEYSEVFAEKSFFVHSCLSRPPLFGGGSWLSYTSFIFGIKVEDMNQYNLLFRSNSSFKYYQSLLTFLKSSGYKNYLLCPLGGGYDNKVDWDKVKRNFDADEFLDWERMEYEGRKYKYVKMGYNPSDQYSIHKAHEIIEESGEEPYSLFFSTLNSHMPFDSPADIVDNWQDLQLTEDSEEEEIETSLPSKYKQAILYQMKNVLDYISKKDKDDTIYILFGDHQPPFITKKEMGFSTPIHIISKNRTFAGIFEDAGFQQGFYPHSFQKELIKHEAFYSLFMKAFNGAYGFSKNLELPYLPNGIQLK